MPVDLAGSTGRQEDRPGLDANLLARMPLDGPNPSTAAESSLPLYQEVDDHEVFHHADFWPGCHCFQERVLNGESRPVARVDDAAPGVSPLPTERESPRLLLEPRPPCHEILDAGGSLADHHLHHLPVAQTRSRQEGVLDVERWIVIGAHHRGNSAPCPVGVRLGTVLLGE